MEELMEHTKATIRDFSKSVSKLNLYSDRLILEAEKSCVRSSQLKPSDEKIVIETTQQAIKFIHAYADLLKTQKLVESKKKTLPEVDYPQFEAQTIKTLDNLKSDVVKLKLFQEYSARMILSLETARAEDNSIDTSSSSSDNSYSFS